MLLQLVQMSSKMNPPSRGRNYVTEELKQVCVSVLAVSQCPVVGNGQRSEKFWERVEEHYHRYKPEGGVNRNAKSIEGKWGDIKHDVDKFLGVYTQVESLQISGTSNDDTLMKAHELYRQNHPKNKAFSYETCFWILKDYPRWQDPNGTMSTDKRSRSSKSNSVNDRQNSNGTSPNVELDQSDSAQPSSDEAVDLEAVVDCTRPSGNKKVKEDLKRHRIDEEALKASKKAAENFEKAQMEQNYCNQVNTMMRLIMMPTASLNPSMRAFAEEFQLEEAQKLRAKIREQSHRPPQNVVSNEEEQSSGDVEPLSPTNGAPTGDFYMPSTEPANLHQVDDSTGVYYVPEGVWQDANNYMPEAGDHEANYEQGIDTLDFGL